MGQSWLAVGLGGALGSLARHGVNVWVTRRMGQSGPYATLVVNIVGCGVIGLLAGLLASERLVMTPTVRVFVFVGILGGFTTFSSFGLDTFTLAREGRHAAALLNAVGQVVIGLAALAAGYFAALKT
ncbi:MAG TPA: fluoride efflux transporter CrcB [Vicinamibacteria bacterium]|nr:fluoride efflux transporter CrcB [Vicinamibacteria bacterium]